MKQQNTNRLTAVKSLLLAIVTLSILACSSEQKFQLVSGSPASLLNDERLQVINYWATWCLPCLEEMPELAAFRNKYLDRLEVYAVNYDQPELAELQVQIEQLGVEIPALVEDPYQILGYQRPTVLPTTVVLHRGQVKQVLVGPQTLQSLESILQL